jgi:hypothetical protein
MNDMLYIKYLSSNKRWYCVAEPHRPFGPWHKTREDAMRWLIKNGIIREPISQDFQEK